MATAKIVSNVSEGTSQTNKYITNGIFRALKMWKITKILFVYWLNLWTDWIDPVELNN